MPVGVCDRRNWLPENKPGQRACEVRGETKPAVSLAARERTDWAQGNSEPDIRKRSVQSEQLTFQIDGRPALWASKIRLQHRVKLRNTSTPARVLVVYQLVS